MIDPSQEAALDRGELVLVQKHAYPSPGGLGVRLGAAENTRRPGVPRFCSCSSGAERQLTAQTKSCKARQQLLVVLLVELQSSSSLHPIPAQTRRMIRHRDVVVQRASMLPPRFENIGHAMTEESDISEARRPTSDEGGASSSAVVNEVSSSIRGLFALLARM